MDCKCRKHVHRTSAFRGPRKTHPLCPKIYQVKIHLECSHMNLRLFLLVMTDFDAACSDPSWETFLTCENKWTVFNSLIVCTWRKKKNTSIILLENLRKTVEQVFGNKNIMATYFFTFVKELFYTDSMSNIFTINKCPRAVTSSRGSFATINCTSNCRNLCSVAKYQLYRYCVCQIFCYTFFFFFCSRI